MNSIYTHVDDAYPVSKQLQTYIYSQMQVNRIIVSLLAP